MSILRNLRCYVLHCFHLDCEMDAWGYKWTCLKCGHKWES